MSMHFPQHWAKSFRGWKTGWFGKRGVSAWGWSDTSDADAQQRADERLSALVDRIEKEGYPAKRQQYYPLTPFREQIVTTIPDPFGSPLGVVSRNAFGCLVLNTSQVMFVDIDIPELEESNIGSSRTGVASTAPWNKYVAPVVERVVRHAKGRAEMGWRIYRTRAGIRLLATNNLYDPQPNQITELFQELGADPLYLKLCLAQKCFRARLTPKPWRIGVRPTRLRWPYKDEREERRFADWANKYAQRSDTWATCEFIQSVGNPEVHPDVEPIVEIHDRLAEAKSGKDLA